MIKRMIIFPILHLVGVVALIYAEYHVGIWSKVDGSGWMIEFFNSLAIFTASLLLPYTVDKKLQKSGADFAMCVTWLILSMALVFSILMCFPYIQENVESDTCTYILMGTWYTVFLIGWTGLYARPPKVVQIGGVNA